jgi:two-component system, cell cycle response regulator DivK
MTAEKPETADTAATEDPADEPKRDREAPLVLVVDDVADGREIVGEYLKMSGYELDSAADGVEAVQKAQDLLPDVILMDVWLPKMDGLEATRRLRQDPRTKEIPIIALTAHGLASARGKALDAGCDAVITKPFLPEALEQEIERQLARRRG